MECETKDRARSPSAQARGVTLAEAVIAALVLGLLLVPLYGLVTRGWATAFRSRFALLAAQLAREEIEDVQVLARWAPDPRSFAHDFRAPSGAPVDRLGDLAKPVRGLAAVTRPYPPDYARVFTRLSVEPTGDPRIHRAILDVRWQEEGERPEDARAPAGLGRFEFLIVRSKVGAR